MIIFIAIKAFNWGINIPSWEFEFHLKPHFCALSGLLSMSYYIHNIIVSIMKNNRNQHHNVSVVTLVGLISATLPCYYGIFQGLL